MVAITTNGGSSVGYIGTEAVPSYDTAQWASAQPGLGERYWVESQSAGETVRVPSLARTVSIGKGRIGAFGVVDTLVGDTQAAQLQVQFPNPSSGSVHHMVVARRWWETTNASSIETVTGTADPVVPARPYTNPGNTRDDQPLGLWRVTKDDPLPVLVADLRVVGNKGRYEATSKLVLDIPGYVDHPGYVVRIAGTDYLRTADGAWEITAARPVTFTAAAMGTSATGWLVGALSAEGWLHDGMAGFTIHTRRTGATIAPSTAGIGNIPDQTILTIDNPALKPRAVQEVNIRYRAGTAAAGYYYTGAGTLHPDGRLVITNLSPNTEISRQTDPTYWSVRASAVYPVFP